MEQPAVTTSFDELQRPSWTGLRSRTDVLLCAAVSGIWTWMLLLAQPLAEWEGVLRASFWGFGLLWIVTGRQWGHIRRHWMRTTVTPPDAVRVVWSSGTENRIDLPMSSIVSCRVWTGTDVDGLVAWGISSRPGENHLRAEVRLRGSRGILLTLDDSREIVIGSGRTDAICRTIVASVSQQKDGGDK